MNDFYNPLRETVLMMGSVCRSFEENLKELRRAARKLCDVAENDDERFDLEEIVDALVEIRGHIERASSKMDKLAAIIPSQGRISETARAVFGRTYLQGAGDRPPRP